MNEWVGGQRYLFYKDGMTDCLLLGKGVGWVRTREDPIQGCCKEGVIQDWIEDGNEDGRQRVLGLVISVSHFIVNRMGG